MSFDYEIKQRKNARRLKLSVHPDGRVVVSAPKRMGKSSVISFIKDKMEWINAALARFSKIPPYLHKGNRKDFLKCKAQALSLVQERLRHFNAHPSYGFPIDRISIRNQQSRWGSCSSKGNLNFNYKIVLLPPELADYLVVHELCHIGQLNHSRAFWDLVAETIPDYKERRRKLKKGL